MRALVDACRAEGWRAEVACVIASRADAPGLALAAAAGVATDVVDRAAFADRAAFEVALGRAIDAHRPDCVALAGFMRVLSDAFVHRYADRMLNVHPSLLPAFPGLATHARALAGGVRVHGATVHFVVPAVDSGPIVAQAAIAVAPDDTAASLEARVLAAEHRLYPRAVRWFVDGDAVLDGARVRLAPHVAALAAAGLA